MPGDALSFEVYRPYANAKVLLSCDFGGRSVKTYTYAVSDDPIVIEIVEPECDEDLKFL